MGGVATGLRGRLGVCACIFYKIYVCILIIILFSSIDKYLDLRSNETNSRQAFQMSLTSIGMSVLM